MSINLSIKERELDLGFLSIWLGQANELAGVINVSAGDFCVSLLMSPRWWSKWGRDGRTFEGLMTHYCLGPLGRVTVFNY